ncbi:coiled-coil domain-containing protein 14-like isoform X2 [Cynoglossus semilaevis]|uniref:coiled-coil domain-containing protein 14-like isoform X2 n=1 Tax=Cynoglossus semilaevis TaxID=244447 RepID=UPI0007DCA56B|nr:coiled-coil domain-containing protein 14-like isoform X2 [Cynoglossus semilaevis]
MDFTKDNMTRKDMLEKIAELDYSQNQLRDMNSAMRNWLDAAEDDIAVLRSENAALRKQVKILEKLPSEAHQDEVDSSPFLLTDNQDFNRCSEKKIQELEEESSILKEQNKKLTSELKNIEQEREQDKISLGKLQVAQKTLEFEMEAAQMELQVRGEVIHQNALQLKHLKETIEECANLIKDLRQTNQELKERLEERQDEALLSAVNELTEESERSASPPLSFLDEMKLFASTDEFKTSMSNSEHFKHEEAKSLEVPKTHSIRVDPPTGRNS